ncbi:MAG: DUF349 domain-containing protein, partial [Salibacteraceae bacterium]
KDEENIGKAYSRFNAIKQKWNETGPVPRAQRRDLQAEYSRLIELFYYNISIYRELQINDLKKNQELKEALIDKIKLLQDEKSVNQVDFLIHKYLDEWDEIGPTFKDKWDEIRDRFRGEVGKVFDRIRDHKKAVKEEHKQNFEQKSELVEKVKAIAEQELDDLTKLQKITKEVIGIQKEWKKIGFAGRAHNDKVWADFRAACDAYFAKRDSLMEESNAEMKKVREAKQKLIDRAKEIYQTEDFNSVANELKGMQRQWKQAGKLLPHEEYKFFKEFRKYCDAFFNKKKVASEEQVKAAKESLQKKEALLVEISQAIEAGIKDKGEKAIEDWRKQWNELGEVPYKMKSKVEGSFENAMEKAYRSLGISKTELKEKQFKSKLKNLSNAKNADDQLARERSAIIQKIKETQTALAQEESKLDFFKFSKDDNPLKKELLQRIDAVKKEIDSLKNKKKRIDLTIKELAQEDQEEKLKESEEHN